MAAEGPAAEQMLRVPAVLALKAADAATGMYRGRMERTLSEDIREQRQELQSAAEQAPNVIVDLALDGRIRWVSPSWQDVIGTAPESVQGMQIGELLVDNSSAFADAVESLQKDDSRSHIIRFSARMGPSSVLQPSSTVPITTAATEDGQSDQVCGEERILNLEAQGIMVYNRTSGGESHTMWMVRPYVVREVTIDLPPLLVESLGVGAEMLAQHLTALAEVGMSDPANHPPPLPVLCRICERHITPWWFEKHTELCMQEHKAEMDVQLAQESLTEHRNAIVKVLDALESQSTLARTSSGDSSGVKSQVAEYKGLTIGPTSTPSSGPSSGRASPATPPARSGEATLPGIGHQRTRSFAVRRPLARIVELVLDLCDTALEINMPAIKSNRDVASGELRTQSPQSENRISQVLQWQSPSTGTLEQEQGLSLLCDDTSSLSRAKVEAVLRYCRILEYSERIRVEFEVLVQECIDAALQKASQIAAGELSDSSEDTPEQADPHELAQSAPDVSRYSGCFEGSSAMAMALRNSSDPSLVRHPEHRTSSTAGSTRSNSPHGAQTPKSNAGLMSMLVQGKRHSIQFESDAGADSDSSVLSSVLSGPRRTESPSELGLTRVTSSRERKRKSLILPSLSSRQHSPARNGAAPSSPLRMNKPRLPSGSESMQSPITSPILSTSEFSSPIIANPPVNHHRRQSSNASDIPRPVSPRLMPVHNPQPRAVPTSIKDFEIVKPISKGAFGSVYLSKKKSTGDYFAIKVLKKADMIAKNQVTNVKAERAIMMWQGESDFVAKLYWTFSSKDYLYLVMEYLNGGDCAALIKSLGGLPEDWAKKYLAEVVLGVDHLHGRGIVHRDLKPDNLLIDQKGHLKLTDFGLSRMGLIGRQKRALNSKNDEPVPDLLKQNSFPRTLSVTSSRSASFDLQGNYSPSQTPGLTPAITGDLSQPSYFSLNRENSLSRDPSRRISNPRSDSSDSDALQAMLRRFSIMEDQRQLPIEEESCMDMNGSPELSQSLSTTARSTSAQSNTPPQTSGMLPPPMALFDPEDTNRRFVGTPDYLAPETINGTGQDQVSDWWSLGCILFEFLYGYPPFHADTPDKVFQNILDRKIDWPDDDEGLVSPEAKDLINGLLCIDPANRLGANKEEKFANGGEEIKSHPWFADVNWDSVREDEASFVPAPENPEDTEYFDARGANMQNFDAEFADQGNSPINTPGADYQERPHDALSRVRTQFNSMKRGLMPLHIPPHVRDGRSRRLSEPVNVDDFGTFSFKNLPVLEKANKDVIQKLRAEAMQAQSKPVSALSSPIGASPSPSLESSPMLPIPLQRTMSSNKGANRPVSPSLLSNPGASPSRISQPSSPLLVHFSTGQNHERRKTSSGSSATSAPNHGSLQPGSFFDAPRLAAAVKGTSAASSPVKLPRTPTPGTLEPQTREKVVLPQRPHSMYQGAVTSPPRARSQTVGSHEGDAVRDLIPSNHHKRRSGVFDVSPSSSDNEDPRQRALLRVQRRRQSSRRLSQMSFVDGPIFRPLDVIICEDHPVSRLVMEKLLEKLRCRTISVQNGSEAMRYAMGEVKFDLIMTEFKLPQVNGADVARMIRDTKNPNSNTPIVAVTGYLKELQMPHHFDALIEKPPTTAKLVDTMGKLCQWKPAPPNQNPPPLPPILPSSLRRESIRLEDSPTSQSSGFVPISSSSYRGSSREDSISSSFFTDTDSRSDEIPVIINRQPTDDWREQELNRAFGGLGISRELVAEPEPKIGIPQVPHLRPFVSAPPVIESKTPKKQRSGESVGSKRRPWDTAKEEPADSGDDEDEELGDPQVRAKSPKGKARPSKLGIEMLRTNSQGSVVSVEERTSALEPFSSSPPPVISEERVAEEQGDSLDKAFPPPQASLTPPPLFYKHPAAPVYEFDIDATPRPPQSEPDNEPTPRASTSPCPP